MQKAHFLGMATLILLSGCGTGCRNDLVRRVESPSGRHSALLFQRDCGATTGFSTQISVLTAGAEPTDGGNVLRTDAGHDAAVRRGAWHGPWAEIRWLSPQHLLVRYAAGARLFARADEADGIRISYEVVPASPVRP